MPYDMAASSSGGEPRSRQTHSRANLWSERQPALGLCAKAAFHSIKFWTTFESCVFKEVFFICLTNVLLTISVT